jgi:ribosomal protein S18 acetylase RimI-like enzyme
MIRLYTVNADHGICKPINVPTTAEDLGIPKAAFRFRVNAGVCQGCSRAIVAKDGDKLIGFVRIEDIFCIQETWAVGTWVHPAYRQQGLASKMWKRMLRVTRPGVIRVHAVSRNGKRLIDSVKKHTKVAIDLW